MPKARPMPRADRVLAALQRFDGWTTAGQVANVMGPYGEHAPNVAVVLRKLAVKGKVEFSEQRYRRKS